MINYGATAAQCQVLLTEPQCHSQSSLKTLRQKAEGVHDKVQHGQVVA